MGLRSVRAGTVPAALLFLSPCSGGSGFVPSRRSLELSTEASLQPFTGSTQGAVAASPAPAPSPQFYVPLVCNDASWGLEYFNCGYALKRGNEDAITCTCDADCYGTDCCTDYGAGLGSFALGSACVAVTAAAPCARSV